MFGSPSIDELKKRWEAVLTVTDRMVVRQPGVYREIRSLAEDILTKPLDIQDYPMTAERLTRLLRIAGYQAQGTLFHFYFDRFSPSSISRLKLFRAECRDLLASLDAFEGWRRKTRRLRLLK